MRAVATLLLLLAIAGCGGAESPALGTDAAELVPPDAIAFISFDTDLNSDEWRRVTDVWGPLFLSIGDLNFERDVRPAVGDQLDFAVLDADDGTAESIVWLMKPKDESKLPRLVRQVLGPDAEIQQIGGWSVATDSADGSARVRAAHSGRSLADVDWFRNASASLSGNALAAGYGRGEGVQQLSDEVEAIARVLGSPQWVAAHIGVEDDAVRAQVRAAPAQPAPAVYRPRLLRVVPSGSVVAVSFKDAQELLQRVAGEPSLRSALGEYRDLLTDLAPALKGEGVFFVTPGVPVPTIGLIVETPTPHDAAEALRRVRRRIEAETKGLFKFHVLGHGNRVTLTNALVTGGAPFPEAGGRRLVDDPPFKEALDAADVPEDVTWLAYADIQRLVPLLRILSPDLPKLDGVGKLVAFGTRSGLEARLTKR